MYISRVPADFSLRETFRKMRKINLKINLTHQKPFPKSRERLLSFYEYKNAKIRIKKGRIVGGLARLIWALIDFTFVRSIVADAYSKEGGHTHDPVSLFLLDLFKYNLGITMKDFYEILCDKLRGAPYRYYAGIDPLHIPCEADFSNLRVKIGEERYNQIFHVLVEIVELMEFLTFKIVAIDGTLFPTRCRYKGCNRFSKDCASIPVDKLCQRLKRMILYRLKDPSKIKLGQEIKVLVSCPSKKIPKNEKKPRIEVLAFCLQAKGQESNETSDAIVKILGLEDRLNELGLYLKVLRSNVNLVKIEGRKQTYIIRCPRLPADQDARIGVRRDKRNPNKEEMVFGYDAIFITCVEPDLHLEIPVACLTISGNADEGSQFIPLMEQLKNYHPKVHPRVAIGDCKFDILKNYIYARWGKIIPCFDYNVRNENLSPAALRERGYDQNGCPFAPCGCICKPNGCSDGSICFACFKQCDKDPTLKEKASSCEYHEENELGFTKHMKIEDHPRLLLEIPRSSKRYKKIRNLRPSSERTNSTAKDEDKGPLTHPKVKGGERAAILTQITAIVILLKRVFGFILRVSLQLRKLFASNDKELYKKLFLPPSIPGYLKGIVQRE